MSDDARPPAREPDLGPIDQRWVRDYCEAFRRLAADYPEGRMRDMVLARVACVEDLLEAWQKRNWPKGWRE